MKTVLNRFFRTCPAVLLVCLLVLPPSIGYAQGSSKPPDPATPFDGETHVSTESNGTAGLAMPMLAGDFPGTMQAGADRLAALQVSDGGWCWPLTGCATSPLNTVGPIAMGLAQAYDETGDADHLAALTDAGAFLLAKTNNFSPSDGYLAAQLDRVFGGTTYQDHVTTYFYGPLAAGTYNRNGEGVLYDTAAYVNRIRTNRSGDYANLAAWDIGMGLVGAASVGADTSAWIAGVKAEIDELDGDKWYDVVGLAGAVYGLAFAGEDYDPIAGEHAAAGSLADLAAILATYQIAGGGFAWNSNYVIPNDGNETVQETAYAVLALNQVDRAAYLSAIEGATDYLMGVQLVTGGWANYTGSGENNEVTGEALWSLIVPNSELWVCLTGECGPLDLSFSSIQAAIDAAAPGDTIHVAAGTYAESLTVNKDGLTLILAAGTTIQPNSPCFTVSADDTTLSGGVCEPSDGSHGILTGLAVDNLVIQGIEIRKGATATGDGIHIGHDVNNLQIVDCFVHGLDGDGLEYAAGVTISGVHEVQGNLFQGNTGYGINNASAAAYDVTYNAWGDVAGPAGANGDGANGTLTYDPWTHAAADTAWVSGSSPVADRVAVGAEIVYSVRMDAAQVYGADFDLNFDSTLLEVVSVSDAGLFTHFAPCSLSYDNVAGVISFCGYRSSALNGTAQELFQVTFRGVAAGVSALNLDEADDRFSMVPPGGASNNIYAAALTDGSVTVYGAFSVSGRIDLQGRADDTGAVMTFGVGANQGYGPYTFSTSNYWGQIARTGVVADTYAISVSMARYLDVVVASSKTVDISADRVLNTLILYAGDADDSDLIDVSDAAIIGSEYGDSGGGIGDARADINADDAVDLLDMVLMGGNFGKESATAYAAWTP